MCGLFTGVVAHALKVANELGDAAFEESGERSGGKLAGHVGGHGVAMRGVERLPDEAVVDASLERGDAVVSGAGEIHGATHLLGFSAEYEYDFHG